MSKRKWTNAQTTIYKTLKIEQHEANCKPGLNSGVLDMSLVIQYKS